MEKFPVKGIVSSTIVDLSGNFEQGKEQKHVQKKRNKDGKKNELKFTDSSEKLLTTFFGDAKIVREFLANCFQHRPVVRSGNSIESVQELLFDLDVLTLLQNTASDAIHIWMRQLNSDTMESITLDDADQAYKLYQAGHSLYCRAPKELEDLLVQRLSNELNYGIKNINGNDRFRRGEIELFFSRQGHVTKFHTDFQENFTVQLKGRKKWILHKSTMLSPLRGCTLHFNDAIKDSLLIEQQLKVLKLSDIYFTGKQVLVNSTNSSSSNFDNTEQPKKKKPRKENMESHSNNEDNEYIEIILNEGDVFYHPPGLWHRVECIEDSISMNISLTSVSYADIFCCHLQQLLLENPLWRSAVFNPSNADHYPSGEKIMKSILDALPSLMKSLQPQDLLNYSMLHEFNQFIESNEDINEQDDNKDRSSNNKRKRTNNNSEDEEDEEIDDENENDGFEEMEEGSVDEETEEEEEEMVDKDTLFIDEIDLPKFLINCLNKSDVNDPVDIFFQLQFRINPLIMLLTKSDLFQTSSSILTDRDNHNNQEEEEEGESKKESIFMNEFQFIFHNGYGNETLESVSRKVISIASREFIQYLENQENDQEEEGEEDDDEEDFELEKKINEKLLTIFHRLMNQYYQLREKRLLQFYSFNEKYFNHFETPKNKNSHDSHQRNNNPIIIHQAMKDLEENMQNISFMLKDLYSLEKRKEKKTEKNEKGKNKKNNNHHQLDENKIFEKKFLQLIAGLTICGFLTVVN